MNYASDSRLDIVVLGPMGEKGKQPPTAQIRDAVESLLTEPECVSLLEANHVVESKIHIPEGQDATEIVHNILSLLDTADLAIFDLSPKNDEADRANVFYELGLVHSLGIPALLLIQKGKSVPFYARTHTLYKVPDFETETLADKLRSPMLQFLDWENGTVNFTNDRVTQFYGLPVVDISAAVGLATGYYYNFLARLITEGGFLKRYPELIRQVVYVRPSSIQSTYEADIETLKAELEKQGMVLKTEKLPAIESDDKGPLWFDHVDGVVLDIPRTIYPLRRSPRLLALQERNQTLPSQGAKRTFEQRVRQIEDALLNRVESAIEFQIRHDGTRVRKKILHFTSIDEAPAMVQRLLT